MGCLLAQQVALTAPRRVRRLVLANTNFGVGSVPGLSEFFRTLIDRAHHHPLSGLIGPTRDANSGLPTTVRSVHRSSWRGYCYRIMAATGWSSLAALPLIRQPVLVLNGDDDSLIPVANSRILAQGLPDALLVVVPGGGHLMLLDRTTETADVIAGFLTGPDIDRSSPTSITL